MTVLENIDYKVIFKGYYSNRLNWLIIISGEEFSYSEGIGYLKLRGETKGEKTFPVDLPKAERDRIVSKFFRNSVPAHRRELTKFVAIIPKIEDVLHCLFLDASARDMSFIDWADNYGYDTDSIRANKIYDACVENAVKLRTALSKDYVNIREYIEELEL